MNPTLILCPAYNHNNQTLWQAAINRGWDVERLLTYRVPDTMKDIADPVLYIQALFAPTIAKDFGIELKEPPNDWMAKLPVEFSKRKIVLTTMAEARQMGTGFYKPPNDKSFKAFVGTGLNLPDGTDDEPVLVSNPVTWDQEFRCFLLDGKIQTLSRYYSKGTLCFNPITDHERVRIETFVSDVVAATKLPKSVVMDVGTIDGEWAVVELNAAWGSGIYECNPHAVLDCIHVCCMEGRL